MLVQPPIEKLLPKTENRYTLAIAVAKRARQLVDGANPLIDEEQLDSPSLVSLAAEELAENQIAALPGILEPAIPLRPEILQAHALQREEEEEDGFELLRQDLEAKTPEEEPEPEAPKSMVRELRDDELFELPTDLEREFFENFGDPDAEPVPLADAPDVDATDLSMGPAEDGAAAVHDEEAPTDVTIKKSRPRTPSEATPEAGVAAESTDAVAADVADAADVEPDDEDDEDSESLFGDDLGDEDVEEIIDDDLETIDSSIDDVREDDDADGES